MAQKARYLPAGDRALIVELGDRIDPELNRAVHALDASVREARLAGVEETVPTYRSLLVFYDPLEIQFDRLCEAMETLLGKAGELLPTNTRVVTVPTLYGGEWGPDLEFVAAHNRLSPAEVVRIHSSVEFQTYMIGFTPGFPYLGGLPDRLSAPRLPVPRVRIPAGSVGIAGNQSGIYPIESPGGWRLIGRTPIRLYDPGRANPVLLRPGDVLRFLPVDESEYQAVLNEESQGIYQARIEQRRQVAEE